ncbi:MAG: TIGR03943 family protein [Terrimicrobiaceae bacterium]|nr:TIGR03943 family protein [Terrimicrobiaceae bacterium]
MARIVDSLVLAVWGAVALGFVFSGRIASYLHPAFHGWTLASGFVLLALATATLFLPLGGGSSCCQGHSGTHGWLHGLKWLILVAPLLLTVVVSPSQFGAVAVRNRGLADSLSALPGYAPYREPALPRQDGSPGEEGPPLPAGALLDYDAEGRIKASPLDLFYAANIPELRGDFDGREVVVVGQFLPARRNNPGGNRFSLVRMFIMCCEADARPLAIPVQFPSPPSFPEMSWVRVAGTASFPVEGGRVVPVIEARQVEPCAPPEETFLY